MTNFCVFFVLVYFFLVNCTFLEKNRFMRHTHAILLHDLNQKVGLEQTFLAFLFSKKC